MRRQLFDLLTLWPRLIGKLAIATLDSGAIVLGLRWRDSYGRTHWRRAKPRIPVARVVRRCR